jgi:hypothetical protein
VDGVTLTGEEIEPEPYRPVFLTTNAITLSDDVQLVIRFYGTPGEIHDVYDFEHCKCYWCSWRKPGKPADAAQVVLDLDPGQATRLHRLALSAGKPFPPAQVPQARVVLHLGRFRAGEVLVCDAVQPTITQLAGPSRRPRFLRINKSGSAPQQNHSCSFTTRRGLLYFSTTTFALRLRSKRPLATRARPVPKSAINPRLFISPPVAGSMMGVATL